ncbi:MAG TPA: DNA-binding protein [Candidatus Angelobacter sp.]|nr:DNA-binding protein [Candidatus Angelobacter sp.]
MERRLWTGAYYLAGLAVECALKSCLASAVREYDFPDKDFVNKMYDHNLEKLFKLNGAPWAQFKADAQPGSKLFSNWSSAKGWDNEKRYDVVEELDAKQLYDAVADVNSGIVEWIRRRW